MASSKVENINPEVLRQCREQIGIGLDDVKKKVPLISDIEQGKKLPTFRQIDILADLYRVPRWVFIAESLPTEYQFENAVPAYRQFAHTQSKLFADHKVRGLVAEVERLRDFILELRDDMDESIESFQPPALRRDTNPKDIAQQVRSWLGTEKSFKFPAWRTKLEEKNIFIFMTSKYKGWSHVGKTDFRGLSLYHATLPIIIINDSDAKKAQSFTLFHELGHLLRRESSLDGWGEIEKGIEKWCDEFAGNVLMPEKPFRNIAQGEFVDIEDLDYVKQIAEDFQVSFYACLVRMRQLNIIDQMVYLNHEETLKEEYNEGQDRLKESDGGPSRDRADEVLNQYGRIYVDALFQAYYDKDIGLHKLCRLLQLKRMSHVLNLEKKIWQ